MTPCGPRIVGIWVAGLLSLAPLATAASSTRLTGSIAGEVRNPSGVAQMGATVILFNRYDRILQQALTNEKGSFVFDSLLPDVYSVRVTLASFVPALKKNIAVSPGLQSLLTINLAGVLSSIELVYTAPPQGALMSDDWKWVLRSSQSTRPVLRFRDVIYRDPPERASHSSVFSETRGVVRVSAGDGGYYSGAGAQPDLGTAFALVTSLFGANQLEVSGNVGYSSHAGMPTAGFRTTYSRSGDSLAMPEVTVTMRQIYLPARGGFGTPGTQDGAPALRTVSATLADKTQILDNLRLDYGLSVDTISMIEKLNTLSPFARLSLDLGAGGLLQLAFSSGAPPIELAQRPVERNAIHEQELNQDLTALASLPLVSLKDGHPRVQRSDSLEIGYSKVAGRRTYSFGAYREHLKDAILTMAGDTAAAGLVDVLPDLGSRASVYDAGNFDRWGYLASVAQNFAETMDVSLAYGRTGALTVVQQNLAGGDADLRSSLRMSGRNWATVHISGTAPVTGTRFIASYGWMDTGTLMPARISLTQKTGPAPGLNLSIRQPIPSGGLPGRFEAVAEVRNALAQGYLPMSSEGQPLLLTNSPRSVRGGLSFIF